MKGQILDVYPENEDAFRVCVLDVDDGYFDGETGVKVVCLATGEITVRHDWECEEPVIENIFTLTTECGE